MPSQQIIATIDDLCIYLGDAFDLGHDDAKAAAERITERTCARPNYGDDWAEYLDALTPEFVHSLYGGDELVHVPRYIRRDGDSSEVLTLVRIDQTGRYVVEICSGPEIGDDLVGLYALDDGTQFASTNGLTWERAEKAPQWALDELLDWDNFDSLDPLPDPLVIVDVDGDDVELAVGDWYEAFQCDGTEDYDRGRVLDVDLVGRRALIGWQSEQQCWLTVEAMRGGLVYDPENRYGGEPDWRGSWLEQIAE